MTSDPPEEQSAILKELALLLSKSASEQIPDWKTAFHDFRASGDSGSGILRSVAVNDSGGRQWFDEGTEFGNCFENLWNLRETIVNGHWYGFMLILTRTGEVSVTFKYDPNWRDSFDEDEDQHFPY